ncbi:MAG: ABC transporter ATP-binding protein [Ilumatobacteraceae bacterium]|mgnify:FL=1|nr:ABC transporter ATP-binding protein [Ilumatobacteraceae bacterium]MDP5068439.1 ABC transporter ATP-binding protein [Ilumatobacteraceae bacterium]
MSVVVENLSVSYGDLMAVDNVSFEAPLGSVTVILGPNGAGKTSTIEVCEGFRTAKSGSVRVLGLDPVSDHRALTERMGVMLQGGGVYPSARVRDVVSHFCALHNKGVNATQLIERVGLSNRSTGTWRKLSGGEQQRLSLALALAADPEVIFLDEPTSGVDIDGRDIIADIIHDLAARGTTVVLASHDMAEAEKVATHAVLFNSGKVIASGEITSLLTSRKHLRFTSSEGLIPAELAVSIKSPVVALGDGVYEVASEPTPQLMTRISQWLADNSHPLLGVDMGKESLEDTYRRLTRGQQ